MPTYLHRKSEDRGRADHGWLKAAHSFSFGSYHDPDIMGFRALRVINEDRVAGGGGFPTHAHDNMEIVTYLLDGALEHRDSIGNGEIIRPGEAQRMSAGTGIRHSEFNASATDEAHLLQIWLLPSQRGIAPGYEQKSLPTVASGESRLDVIAAPDAPDSAVTIHSDASITRAVLAPGGTLGAPINRGHAWVQVARGSVVVDGHELHQGDGLAIKDATSLSLSSSEGAEALLFDLA
ncbi:pirin family protein [Sandarakinorhabdus sp.]|uniref:pirin family protein n=1 Tax=Sandarakinorhabdus sp. TaxID=1916663 RepID=UPI003341C9FA